MLHLDLDSIVASVGGAMYDYEETLRPYRILSGSSAGRQALVDPIQTDLRRRLDLLNIIVLDKSEVPKIAASYAYTLATSLKAGREGEAEYVLSTPLTNSRCFEVGLTHLTFIPRFAFDMFWKELCEIQARSTSQIQVLSDPFVHKMTVHKSFIPSLH